MAKRNDRIDQREGEIPMDNEGKNGAQTDKQAVLGRLRDTKALYVVVSACTKLPYVVCDTETFDDEVLVFFKPEEAEAKAKSLAKRSRKASLNWKINSCFYSIRICIQWE